MEKKELLSLLKQEHDSIIGHLLKMSRSLMTEEVESFKQCLKKFDEEAGPHFRFDEEAVYPSLIDVYYPGFITKLYTDHDLAIARFNQLKNLFSQEQLNKEDFYDGIRHIRMISQYITNCEIIPIRNIPLNEDQVKRISALHKKCRMENLSLILWSDTKRKRKQLYFT